LFDGLFNVFGCRHTKDITPVTRHEKVGGNVRRELIPGRPPGATRR
jgi:hypothetical protein